MGGVTPPPAPNWYAPRSVEKTVPTISALKGDVSDARLFQFAASLARAKLPLAQFTNGLADELSQTSAVPEGPGQLPVCRKEL